MKKYFTNSPFLIFLFLLIFSLSSIFKGLIPAPADTIIGLYHPFRDLYANDYPNGIPFKNFLITDPVRQIYPWKNLSIDLLAKSQLPTWNPYQMAGTPLIANFQSAVFYPLNIILFVKPFFISWSIFIIMQIILLPVFMYLYLKNLKLSLPAVFLGVVSFSFSGFVVSWFEWGNIIHTALWLPLILLSIDKVYKGNNTKKWFGIFLLGLVFSFFAGHLQTFFYLFLFSFIYLLGRLYQSRNKKLALQFLISYIVFFLITLIQYIPTLRFIFLSARNIDQSQWLKPEWFIPWQNLVQFLAPDFFGNPATLNYWGVWNYAEFVGYIGIGGLILSFFAIVARHDKKTLFFTLSAITSLIFSLPTLFAKLPYIFNFPFLSSAQPTRLLFVVCFSLSVLSALGLDYLLSSKKIKNRLIFTIGFLSAAFIFIWYFVIFKNGFNILDTNILTAKRNFILPTVIFIFSSSLLLTLGFFKNTLFRKVVIISFLILVSFDAYRFFTKFETFTKSEYLFPTTKTIDYLQKDKDIFRIASNDSRIFPPNFSTMYKLQSIEGYDPLYLYDYAAFIGAVERGEPNIQPPFGFNRIITPHNVDSKFIDFLNVKYVLSFDDLPINKFEKVFQEGKTKVYKNKRYFDRVFFVTQLIYAKSQQDAIKKMFEADLSKSAIVFEDLELDEASSGSAKIVDYQENTITIETKNKSNGFLVLADAYYPTWRARVDGRDVVIYKTNLAFRGIFVSAGTHVVKFYNTLF